MTGRYVNPYTDFGFKLLFGTPMNKDLLIGFLNALLRDEAEITDVTYLNAEQLGRSEGDRKAVFDVYCVREREGGAVHCGDAEGTAEIFQRPERVLFDFPDPGAGKSGGLGL